MIFCFFYYAFDNGEVFIEWLISYLSMFFFFYNILFRKGEFYNLLIVRYLLNVIMKFVFIGIVLLICFY